MENPPDLRTPRRRRSGYNDATSVDRLPPHSPEAEQGVLSCCLEDPQKSVPVCIKRIQPGAFYDLRNDYIFIEMVKLFENQEPIDLVTLRQRLKDKRILEEVGGIAYLNSWRDIAPSVANLPWYLDILCEKHSLRKLIHTCTEVVSRLYDANGDASQIIADANTSLVSAIDPFRNSALQEHWTLERLAGYDTANDPNAVIGWHEGKATRYLCRGYSAWIIAQAGIGKSSLAQQQACLWALGKPFCGIMPARKGLRILIVQNENDEGDAAEAIQGILDGSEFFATEIETLRQNVKLIRCRGLTGGDFCRWLEREVAAFAADIVYVDPLLRYAGIDVSRQDQCTKFLNNELDPVLARTGVVMIGIHHTGKPKSKRETEGWTIYDFAYSGIGSSELVNWARAISIVTPEKGGHFHMMLAKRGSRAWATHPGEQEPTTSIYLRHAQGRIFWEQIAEPPPPERKERAQGQSGRPSKVEEITNSKLDEFLLGCKPEGEGLNFISRRLMTVLAKNKIDASISVCKKAITLLVSNGKLTKNVTDEAVAYVRSPNV